MTWTLEFLPEARKDFDRLAGNQKILVAKAIEKVRRNPVPIFEGGYGKPLGNKGGRDLICKNGCLKRHPFCIKLFEKGCRGKTFSPKKFSPCLL